MGKSFYTGTILVLISSGILIVLINDIFVDLKRKTKYLESKFSPNSEKIVISQTIRQNSNPSWYKPVSGPRRLVFSADCNRIINGDISEIMKAKKINETSPTSRKDNKYFIDITKNCTDFKRLRDFGIFPVTEEERSFPIAFSILMYKDVYQTERLLKSIYRSHNVYCIHVDFSSEISVHEAIYSIASCFNNVFVVSKTEDIIYGGISRLQADINCMKDLFKHKTKWKYFINLPSQEFPLKTNNEIVKVLKIYNGANDILGLPIKAPVLAYRYKYKHYFNKTSGRMEIDTKLRRNPPPPHNITIVKGSAYNVFSRDFVKFTLNNRRSKDLLDWAKDVKSPDEYYWATLNHNKNLNAPGGYTGSRQRKPWLAAYVLWYEKARMPRCHGKFVRWICVFGVGDLPGLVIRKELFVNKIYSYYQPLAFSCLEEWMFNKSMNQLSFNTSFYRQLPFIKH